MRHFNYLLICFALALCLSKHAVGQTGEEPKISARFATLLWLSGTPKGSDLREQRPELYYRNGDDYERLSYQVNQIGAVQEYRGSPQVSLYRQDKSPEGKLVYVPISTSQVLPAGTRKFMLFIQPTDAAGGVYSVAVNVSSDYIEKGSMLLLNLSQHNMVIQVGEEREGLEPGHTRFFKPPFDEGQADIPVKVAVFDQKKNEWKRAYSSMTRLLSSRPYMGIFYLSGNRPGAYRFRLFTQLYLLDEPIDAD